MHSTHQNGLTWHAPLDRSLLATFAKRAKNDENFCASQFTACPYSGVRDVLREWIRDDSIWIRNRACVEWDVKPIGVGVRGGEM